MDVSRKEQIVILVITIFSLFWVFFAMPRLMESEWFVSLIPPLQFVIFEVGWIVLFAVFVRVPLNFVIGKKKGKGLSGVDTFKISIALWFMAIIYDLWQPPYGINSNGQIILDVPLALTGASVEVVIGWTLQKLSLSGPIVYYLTYAGTSIVLIVVIALLLAQKQFESFIKELLKK